MENKKSDAKDRLRMKEKDLSGLLQRKGQLDAELQVRSTSSSRYTTGKRIHNLFFFLLRRLTRRARSRGLRSSRPSVTSLSSRATTSTR